MNDEVVAAAAAGTKGPYQVSYSLGPFYMLDSEPSPLYAPVTCP